VLVEKSGQVFYAPAGQPETAVGTNQPLGYGDTLRTGALSRATVQFGSLTGWRMREFTTLQLLAPPSPDRPPILNLLTGSVYFFSVEGPRELQIQTPLGTCIIKGTSFEVSVNRSRALAVVYDGTVQLTNAISSTNLQAHEEGLMESGGAPQKAPLRADSIVQWWLYYPGVLDTEELTFTAAQRLALSPSLEAYRSGDLQRALEAYGAATVPPSPAEQIYHAQLLLAAGEAGRAKELLGLAEPSIPEARALRLLLAVVEGTTVSPSAPATASEHLAMSYYYQSRFALARALDSARAAVELSPRFGYGWERVAELEFSFGRTAPAGKALERALALSPRNAQAHALRGFILSAQNRIGAAIQEFDWAIDLDGNLANAWLGRGLCYIRRGNARLGRLNLETAALLEANRALLHSYLGKALADAGDELRASKELRLARKLDPNDPTSWLYSALLKQQGNQINEAIADLENSEELNTNRSLFRSRLLLDEDQAVRSVNLASIYRDAGMTDVSVREAAKAVTYDYANDSAHLFLSDAYNDLRDPTRFNLRYETVWFNELLLANLLSPVGGGRLSQNVSQQEYSPLFRADGLGGANSTVLRSDGMITELASQFGTYGRTSYAFDLDYQHNDGIRPNNDLASIEWYTTLKQQVADDDTVLALIKYENYHSGDNFQYYDPRQARPYYRFDEYQDPIVVGAWHHEWGPGMHTLLLGGRLITEQHFSDRAVPGPIFAQDTSGAVTNVLYSGSENIAYDNEIEIYTAELNQICEWNRVTISAGGRYQGGSIRAQTQLTGVSPLPPPESLSDTFERFTACGYLTLEPVDRLWLTGGLAYDTETYPYDFRQPPLATGEANRSQVGPKAALVWSPVAEATVRGDFTRSLGGVSLDESYRLEPTQLAGFPQAFRSLIPESLVGSVDAPEFQTFGLALDLKFPTRTYAGVEAQRLETNLRRGIGVFSYVPGVRPLAPNSTPEDLDYGENLLAVSLGQLVGDMVAVGASYKLDQVRFRDVYPQVPATVLPRDVMQADLHQATAYIVLNHPSGFFARAETQWYNQHNSGYSPALPGDNFFQESVYAGYRFARRRVQILLGILDVANQDYHLNPLSTYAELPRKRTFEARVDFQF